MKTCFLNLSVIGSLTSIVLIGLSSCLKNTDDKDCKACTPIAADKVLTVKIGTVDKSFNLWKNDGRSNKNNYCLLDAKASYNVTELQMTLDGAGLLHKIGVPASSLTGIVYFVNKDLAGESSYSLEKSDLKAAFIYYEDGKKLMVRVFREQEGIIAEVKELASETNAISYNDFEDFSELYFNSEGAVMSAILMTENSKTGDHKGSQNFFSRKIRIYTGSATGTKPTGSMYNLEHFGANCGMPCPRDGKLSCHKRLGTPTCNDLTTDCSKSSLQPWNSYPAGQDPRDPILHAFKNSFMAKSAMGQHFIDDFYYIGAVLKDNMNAAVAAQSFTIIDNTVIPIINKLMNDAQSTEIIYDAATRDKLVNYINSVKTLSDDPVFVEMLEEVQGNISLCSGKTVKVVCDELMVED